MYEITNGGLVKNFIGVTIKVLLFFLLISLHLNSEEMKKHPGWAIVASVVLPGGGQFYAENYARGLFFSTLQVTLLSLTLYEKIQERDYKKMYDESQDKDIWDEYNRHRSRVRNLLWWDAGIWFLSCADAFTDAHFYGFDEDVGLTMQLSRNTGTPLIGIAFKF
jgi:hypothetical protein